MSIEVDDGACSWLGSGSGSVPFAMTGQQFPEGYLQQANWLNLKNVLLKRCVEVGLSLMQPPIEFSFCVFDAANFMTVGDFASKLM